MGVCIDMFIFGPVRKVRRTLTLNISVRKLQDCAYRLRSICPYVTIREPLTSVTKFDDVEFLLRYVISV